MKILSIDFDYFIDATLNQRNDLFPNGADEVEVTLLKEMWENCYILHPEIKNIDVISDYNYMQSYLSKYNRKDVLICDSHKEIQQIIIEVPLNEKIEILNIDFHHDYYSYFTNGDNYNCGNWVRRLLEDKPNTLVEWVRRKDSQTISLDGGVPFKHTTSLSTTLSEWGKFDKIFICKSPEWTPPHLDYKFNQFINSTQM